MEATKTKLDYYIKKTLECPFEEASERIVTSLQKQEFGVITQIEMHDKIKDKLGIEDMKPYRILGVCNPKFAHESIQAEEDIGLFLPCKVLVKQIDDNSSEVVLVDPSAIMNMLGNGKLTSIANEVSNRFNLALEEM